MPKDSYHGGVSDILYSNKDHERTSDLFGLILKLMKAMGAIRIEDEIKKRFPKALRDYAGLVANCYCAFVLLQSGHASIFYIKTTIDMIALKRIQEATDGITMVVIYSFTFFSTSYWLMRSKRLLTFLDEVCENYRHHSLAGLTFVTYRDSYNKAQKFARVWLASCLSGVSMWALTPLLRGVRALPLECWYPFDVLKPGVFEVVYFFQYLTQLNCGVTFYTGSSVYVLSIIYMVGQFDVLYCSLKNLDFHGRLMSGEDLKSLKNTQDMLLLGMDDELNQYAFSQEHKTDLNVFPLRARSCHKSIHKSLHDGLVECVQMHRFILKCCDTMEELFNPYCLVKSMQITVQLCLLVFAHVTGERSLMVAFNQIQYLVLTLTELLMFTYCGELLRTHSFRCGEAFWRSQWWLHSTVIRKDILIFLANSQRMVRLTAGKFFGMDIERLKAVITQAFSFFTLLQNLVGKREK